MTSTSSISSVAAAYDVEALREQQFPITRNTVYLQNAGIAPIPRRTFEAMKTAAEFLMLDPIGGYEGWLGERSQACGETLRALINAHGADEIVGVPSTSVGFGFAAQALAWKRGENVILCDVEFPSNVYPWMRLQEQYGVELRLIPNDSGGLTRDAVKLAADANTRLIAVSALQFFTGHRTDLQALGDFCHERKILFAVDAIQSAGHIPIDVQAMHIDILSSGGQKSLMGPPGQGFLYVRRDLANQMQPTVFGSNAVEDWQHWLKYDLTPLAGTARFQMGTSNLVGIVGLQESVTMLREIGLPAIDAYVTALANYAIDRLKDAGFPVITPNEHGPIVTFRAADSDAATDALALALKQQRIFVAKHWDAHDVPYMRASLHCFNNVTDIDRLLSVLKENRQ